MRQIINVQILRPALTRQIGGAFDEFCSKPLSAKFRMNGRIKQKRMHAAVAGDFDKASKRCRPAAR